MRNKIIFLMLVPVFYIGYIILDVIFGIMLYHKKFYFEYKASMDKAFIKYIK